MTYYIVYENAPLGPYALEQMKEMVASGLLTPDSLVFAEGATEWQPAKTIAGLFDAPKPQAPKAQEEPAPKSEAAPKKSLLGLGKKEEPAKQEGFSLPKPSVGTPVAKAATLPVASAAPADATPEQRAAFEAAMAKKSTSGSSKLRLYVLVGLLAVVALGAAAAWFILFKK